MTRTLGVRGVSLLLVLALALCVPVDRCCAQTTTSSDEPALDKRISLAAFVIAVGVLFWVGWKMDRETVELERDQRLALTGGTGPEVVIDLGGLPEDAGEVLRTPRESDVAGSVGLAFDF